MYTKWISLSTKRDSSQAFATPLLHRVNGERQLLVAGGKLIGGYDPATGAELWSRPFGAGRQVPSLVADGSLALMGGTYFLDVYLTENWVVNAEIAGVFTPLTIENSRLGAEDLSLIFYIPIQFGFQFIDRQRGLVHPRDNRIGIFRYRAALRQE